MHKTILSLFIAIIFQLTLSAQDSSMYWPKQIVLDDYVLTVYAPESEKLENNILDGRAAFSLYDKQHLPIFGAMWFRCRVLTDVAKNEVYFEDIQVVNANFPEASVENIKQLQNIIASSSKDWRFNTNLKEFYEKKASLDQNTSISESLNNTPPKIYFSKVPAMLVSIDGEPILEKVNGSALYQYVVNTSSFIVQSSSDKQFYLSIGNWWYISASATGPWKTIQTPPSFILQLAKNAKELNQNGASTPLDQSTTPPKLIVANEPAELIQTDGEPDLSVGYESIFTISNSDDEIVYESTSDQYYILLSGRWYKTRKLESGTWAFVEPETLPIVFRAIPTDSPLAHLRLSVPGTPEAISAALDNAIPQTAVVDRNAAIMQLDFDGEPQFAPIDGTKLQYGVNTSGCIIMDVDSKYYAVDQAIWFTSDSPKGPWKVADHFPDEVKKLPANCPVFNLKYVYIYDSSPDVVYVGYTAGYTGAFIYHGIVVFGTGYRYKSWYGNLYIPGPYTYGYGTKAKKKSNVNVFVSYGYGYGGYGYGGYPYGGYGYGFGNTYVNPQFFMDQTPVDHGTVERKAIDPLNIYNNRSVGIIKTETALRNDATKPIILDNNTPARMYADKDGKLYSQDDLGNWYIQNGSNWNKTTDPTK